MGVRGRAENESDDGRILSFIDNVLMFKPDAIGLAYGLVTPADIRRFRLVNWPGV